MKFTGERFLPEIAGDIYIEHYLRYYAILPFMKNKKVLDIACGSGYGSDLIANEASKVCGVDISSDTISHAEKTYRKNNLEFLVGSTSNIPYEDNTFDVVVSFETIEHHDEHEQMMNEIKRVLKPDGVLIISSPDKIYYNKTLNEPNKFHVKELEFNEFENLLKAHFKNTSFYFQANVYGSIIVNDISEKLTIVNKQGEIRNFLSPKYDICIASDSEIKAELTSMYIDNSIVFNKINQLEQNIRNMHNSLTWKIGRFILAPFSFFIKK